METETQINLIKQDIKEINNHLESIDKKNLDSGKTLDKILVAITGDEDLGNKGLVRRVEYLEKQDSESNARYNKFLGILIAASAILEGLKIFIDLKFK